MVFYSVGCDWSADLGCGRVHVCSHSDGATRSQWSRVVVFCRCEGYVDAFDVLAEAYSEPVVVDCVWVEEVG